MRTAGRTKRELAISAAQIGTVAAQVRFEADHRCLTDQEQDKLQAIGRRLEEIAESLFTQAQPGAGRTVFNLNVNKRLRAAP